MNCHSFMNVVDLYREGRLSLRRTKTANAHLAACAACRALAIGLTLMFMLAPASRWGYFVYPAGLLGWLWLSGHGPAGPAAWPAAWSRLRRRHAERALPRPATMVR